jgi:AP-1 complex subunit gamma-1
MGRVLAPDVARQLGSSNSYVRKKAALALIRILKRLPELSEDYVDRMITLLKDRSHGVLITAIQLLADVAISEIISNILLYCRRVPLGSCIPA